MSLPFSPDQFFGVFADYNRAFWVVVIGSWLATATALIAARRNPSHRSRQLTYLLSALGMWNAVAYHAWLFTRINPAAWLFAAFFAVQSVLLFAAGRRLEYFSSRGWTLGIGTGLAVYALAYPLLTIAFGHSYPATPTFGVPCPTAILTIGVLLTVRRDVPAWLTIVPALWAFIGGSAALLLKVPTRTTCCSPRACFRSSSSSRRTHAAADSRWTPQGKRFF
jgi:hypothetical protein